MNTRTQKLLCFLFVLIALSGVVLRFSNLDRVVVWYDEALTLLNISGHTHRTVMKELIVMSTVGPLNWKSLVDKYQRPAQSFNDVIEAYKRDVPAHAPGLYEALWFWSKVFGGDVPQLRLFSALLGTLTIPAFAWFAWELFRSRTIAQISTAMISLSPILFCYSQELREYSIVAFVYALSSAAFLRASRTDSIKVWCLYLAINVIGLHCTFMMLLILLSHAIYSLILAILEWRKTKAVKARALLTTVVIFAITAGINSFQFLTLYFGRERLMRRVDWLNDTVSFELVLKSCLFNPLANWLYHPEFTFLFGIDRYNFALPALLLLLVFEIACCYFLMRRAPKQFLFLTIIFLIFASVFWGQDLVNGGGLRCLIARYILPVTMNAVFPAAFVIDYFFGSGQKWKKIGAVIASILLMGCQIQTLTLLTRKSERGAYWYRLLPVVDILNKSPKTVVLADSEQTLLPQVLALGHLIDKEHQIAWVDWPLPDWLYKRKRAYLLHTDQRLEAKYRSVGFDVSYMSKPFRVSRLKNQKLLDKE